MIFFALSQLAVFNSYSALFYVALSVLHSFYLFTSYVLPVLPFSLFPLFFSVFPFLLHFPFFLFSFLYFYIKLHRLIFPPPKGAGGNFRYIDPLTEGVGEGGSSVHNLHPRTKGSGYSNNRMREFAGISTTRRGGNHTMKVAKLRRTKIVVIHGMGCSYLNQSGTSLGSRSTLRSRDI
jgi:hypothetical protein